MLLVIYGYRPFAGLFIFFSISMILLSCLSKGVFYRHSYKEAGVRCDMRTLIWVVFRSFTHMLYFMISISVLVSIFMGILLEIKYSDKGFGWLTVVFWIGEVIYLVIIFKAVFSIVYCIKLRKAY